MSQMIDGAHDDYDALDPLEGDRSNSSGARRGRRGQRAVIVDESYGDAGFHASEPEFAEGASAVEDEPFFEEREWPERSDRRSRGKSTGKSGRERSSGASDRSGGGRSVAVRSARSSRRAAEQGGGRIWWMAAIAALCWVGAVLGFSAGVLRLPAESMSALANAAMSLDPRAQLMVIAVAIAPLGMVLQTAIAARRSQRLGAETRRLMRMLDTMGADRAAGGDAEAEADIEAAEERMRSARERLENERDALTKLVEDIEAQAARAGDAVGGLAGGGRIDAADLAAQVAALLREGGDAPAGRAAAAPTVREPRFKLRETAAAASPREKVQRMAEAAKHSFDAPDASDPYGQHAFATEPQDEATKQLSALRNRLQSQLDEPEQEPGLDDDNFDDDGFEDDRYDDEPFDEAANGGDAQGDGFGDDEPLEPPRDASRSVGVEDAARREAPAEGGEGLDWNKFIRAANFPDSEDDRETLDALYAVLTDREAAALLQSAEDALSSLADLGLFMEDMQPRHAPVEMWRAYVIDGARDNMMDLGGVRDPHAIEDVSAALHEKPEFEETAKRFMERYEAVLTRLFNEAPSPRMSVELADTRSGRAYMLVGRAFGRFG